MGHNLVVQRYVRRKRERDLRALVVGERVTAWVERRPRPGRLLHTWPAGRSSSPCGCRRRSTSSPSRQLGWWASTSRRWTCWKRQAGRWYRRELEPRPQGAGEGHRQGSGASHRRPRRGAGPGLECLHDRPGARWTAAASPDVSGLTGSRPQGPQAEEGGGRSRESRVVPRSDAHVSPEAPISLSLTAGPGVKLAKEKLVRGDAKETKAKGVEFEVPFTAASAARTR